MKLTQITKKQLLLSSQDQQKIFTDSFTVEGISFSVGKMQYLVKMENDLKESVYSQLIGLKKTAFGDFNSAEGLELYFSINGNKIVVVSAGEKQPMLFQLWCEGVWEINSLA